MVFSPASLARALLDLDDDEIVRRYLTDLDSIFPGLSRSVVDAHVQRWPLDCPTASQVGLPCRGSFSSTGRVSPWLAIFSGPSTPRPLHTRAPPPDGL
ncbi:MAG: hypothetical protein ACYCUG_01835 [Acidimicrobiales bacterium]